MLVVLFQLSTHAAAESSSPRSSLALEPADSGLQHSPTKKTAIQRDAYQNPSKPFKIKTNVIKAQNVELVNAQSLTDPASSGRLKLHEQSRAYAQW